jgi:hypothetical protein
MAEARYFHTKTIEIEYLTTQHMGGEQATLSLSEAYRLYKALERALDEAGYPGE